MTTIPVQVDGEAWPQPPGIISVSRLPEQAAMLQRGEAKHFARSISKKEQVKTIEVHCSMRAIELEKKAINWLQKSELFHLCSLYIVLAIIRALSE